MSQFLFDTARKEHAKRASIDTQRRRQVRSTSVAREGQLDTQHTAGKQCSGFGAATVGASCCPLAKEKKNQCWGHEKQVGGFQRILYETELDFLCVYLSDIPNFNLIEYKRAEIQSWEVNKEL